MCVWYQARNSCRDAIRAPWHRAASLPHATSGATRLLPAEVSKPQSVPASSRCGSPIAAAIRLRRSATTFGRSHLLVTCADWPPTPWDSVVPSRDVLDNHPLWARVDPPAPNPCDGWTGTLRETLLVGADVATPVLVIGNEDDLTTPIENTEALAGEIVRSRLVTVSTEGHGGVRDRQRLRRRRRRGLPCAVPRTRG